MKLDLNFEFWLNSLGKQTYVFKLAQIETEIHKFDIRNKADTISTKLFNFVINNNIDVFFTLGDSNQKIFILFFIFCDARAKKQIKSEIFTKEGLTEISIEHEYAKISLPFFKKNFKKFTRIYLENIFYKHSWKKVGNFYTMDQLNRHYFSNQSHFNKYAYHYSYYLSLWFEDSDIDLITWTDQQNIFYLQIKIRINIGIIYFIELGNDIKNIRKWARVLSEQVIKTGDIKGVSKTKDKFPILNKKYLTEVKWIDWDKTKYSIYDKETENQYTIIGVGNYFLLTYPYILLSKSRVIAPYSIDKAITMFNNFNEYLHTKNISYGVINVSWINIEISGYDNDSISRQMGIISEERSNKIYTNVNSIIDEINQVSGNWPYDIAFNIYNNKIQKKGNRKESTDTKPYAIFDIDKINIFFEWSRFPNINENWFWAGDKSFENEIYYFDYDYKTLFEDQIFEFFVFFQEWNKNEKWGRPVFWNDSDHGEVKPFDKCKYLLKDDIDLNSSTVSNNYESIKPAWKPFDKSEIWWTTKCKVDYGNRISSRREWENKNKWRIQYLDFAFSKANQSWQPRCEEGWIKSTFNIARKNVCFTIDLDKDWVINQINNIGKTKE